VHLLDGALVDMDDEYGIVVVETLDKAYYLLGRFMA
jgi:hypothetical protein